MMDPSSMKECLPKGWIMKPSKSQNGKEYFCNPSRKISLWSLPEVLAFERGIRQLEKTSGSPKFKPVASATQEPTVVAGGSSAHMASPDSSSKATCLQPREKPFRMIFKASRKSPRANSTLEDFIAEAASHCSSAVGASKSNASGGSSSGAHPQSSVGKRAAGEEHDASSAPSRKRSRLSADTSSSEVSSSDAGRKGGNVQSAQGTQAGNSKKGTTTRTEIDPTQIGSSATKLWDKLLPMQIKKRRKKKAKEKPNTAANTEEQDIKAKLAAIKAKIDSRITSFSNLSGASSSRKNQSAEGKPAVTSAAHVERISKSASSASVKMGGAGLDKSTSVTSPVSIQKSPREFKSPRERFLAGLGLTEDEPHPATAIPAPVKPVTARQAKKKHHTKPTVVPRPQPDTPTSTSPAGGPQQQRSSQPASPHPPPAPQTSAVLHHYNIPKRSRAAPSLPSPLPVPCSKAGTAPPAAPPPSASPDTSGACPAAAALVPAFGEDRWWPAGTVADQPADQPPVAMALGIDSVIPAPPREDEYELMDLDEPELNEEEVFSQIACLRDRGDSLAAADVRWSPDTAAVTSSVSGEPPAPLSTSSCSVDVEPPAPLSTRSPHTAAAAGPGEAKSAAHRPVTVVVDTNVLIHGVGFVLDLRDSFVDGARAQLLIPWVVVQELDKLKQIGRPRPGQEANVPEKARAAINFLLECFQARHPGVRGQTTAEAAAARGELERRVADDAILECCLAANRDGDVLLLSDDKNLLTKVLLHGLTGVSRQQLLQRTDLCGVTDNMPVTEENMLCFTKIVLRKVLSYVIRREMSLVYGAVWSSMEGVRRPWWSMRDLFTVMCSHRTVFQTVFSHCWPQWQQVIRLATRPVLSEEEKRSLCTGVASLLPLLQPTEHYLAMVQPLTEALQTGTPLPAGPLAALGSCFGGSAAGRATGRKDATARQDDQLAHLTATGGKTVSLASVVTERGREAAVARRRSQEEVMSRERGQEAVMALERGRKAAPALDVTLDEVLARRRSGIAEVVQARERDMETVAARETNGRTWLEVVRQDDSTESDGDRTVCTPPPPDEDAAMGSDGATLNIDSTSAVMDLFQNVWGYVNTCCGLLLDAAGVQHTFQYERPAAVPSPAECAVFLPELGTAVQTLTIALQRLMMVSVVSLAPDSACLVSACDSLRALVVLTGWPVPSFLSLMMVSVVSLTPDSACLVSACDGLRALVVLAGHEAELSAQQLLRFIKSPANRVLLGKGVEQMTDFLKSLEGLQRMVS